MSTKVPIGKASLTPRGEYQSAVVYERLDIVSFNGDSYLYYSLSPGAGIPLTDTSRWMHIGSKGAKGDPGAQGVQGPPGPAGSDGQDANIADANAAINAANAAAQNANDAAGSIQVAVDAAQHAQQSANNAYDSATAAAQSAQAAQQVVAEKVSKAGDTMTGALDAPEFKEGGVKLGDKYAAKTHAHAPADIGALPIVGGKLTGALDAPALKESGVKLSDKYQGINACPFPIGYTLIQESGQPPASIWPGTVWSKWGEGKFPLSAGSGYSLGSMGGTESHQLTSSELPKVINLYYTNASGSSGIGAIGANAAYLNANDLLNFNVGVKDGGQPIPIMPPYKAVNIWTRTA